MLASKISSGWWRNACASQASVQMKRCVSGRSASTSDARRQRRTDSAITKVRAAYSAETTMRRRASSPMITAERQYNRRVGYRTPLEARIAKKTTKAIIDFNLVEDGDRIMVGLSGGKDSWALIQILDVLQQRAPIDFSIVAVNVDSGYEGYQHTAGRRGVPGARLGVPQRAHHDRRGDRRQARERRHAVLAVRAAAPRRAVSAGRSRPAPPRSRSATISTTSSRRCC